MPETILILNAAAMQRALTRIAHEIAERNEKSDDVVLVGIQKGGVHLAQRLSENKAALDLKTPFNFASTNDIVGGNSGSAVVNKKGELVGLIFDGNLQMLPGYYIYEASINRAVSVDSRAIIEAFRKIYKANALADEMTGVKAKK